MMRSVRSVAALFVVVAIHSQSGAAQDVVLSWRLKPAFAIGGAADSVFVLSSLFPRDVATLPGNRLAFVDRVENRIVILGPNGQIQRTMGRPGSGPGEFTFPLGLTVAPDGSLWTRDVAHRILVGFDTAGKPRPVGRLQGFGIVQGLRLDSAGDTLILSESRDTMRLWRARGGRREVLAQLVRPPARSIQGPVCQLTDYLVRPLLSPDLVWDTRAGVVVINPDGTSTIQVVAGMARSQLLRRGLPMRHATPKLAAQSLGRGISVMIQGQRAPCYIPPERVLQVASVAPTLPAYRQLVLQSADTLWAVRYTLPGEPMLADVYSLREGYIGTQSLGSAVPIGFRSDGALVSLEPDADDVPRLVVYQVRH